MSTLYTIPNRPVGSAVRNIGDIISDFDSILAALNGLTAEISCRRLFRVLRLPMD
jgi:hypothetical protein